MAMAALATSAPEGIGESAPDMLGRQHCRLEREKIKDTLRRTPAGRIRLKAQQEGEEVFSETFPTYDAFRAWTIIDKNGDLICWDWTADYGEPFVYCYGTDSYDNITSNDWIISPDIQLAANHAYKAVVTVGLCGYTEEKVEVYMGQGKSVDKMTVPVIESTTVTEEMAYGADLTSGKITIGADGVFNLGVHMISEGGSHGLSLMAVKLYDLGVQDPDAFEPERIYLEQFEAKTAFTAFTVVDINGDGATWSHNNTLKCAQYSYSSKNAADDWLITPGIELQGGRDYKLKFKASTASCAERLEVKCGTSALAGDMEQVLLEPISFAKYDDQSCETTFKVKSAQKYYIGFHAISDKDMDKLRVDDIEIWDMGPNGETPEDPHPPMPEGLPVPYKADLTDPAVFATYTVVDANDDSRSWKYDPIFNTTLYSYSKDNAADDWLISPYLKLEEGKAYKLTINVKSRGEEYPEKLEAKIGTGFAPEDFTIEAIPAATLVMDKDEPAFTLSSRPVVVQSTGVYTVGIHAISEANMSDLEIHGVAVEEVFLDAPGAVTGLKATADPTGELKVTVEFVTPVRNIGNTDIASPLSKVEIYRGEKLLHTLTDVPVGEAQHFVDDDTEIINGINQYSVVAYVGDHAGDVAQVNLFVGTDVPQRASGFTAEDLGDRIRFYWDEVPVVGQNGGVVYPAAVKYNIYATFPQFLMGQLVSLEYQYLESVTGADEIVIDYDELNKGEHETVYFSIRPETKAGEAPPANTSLLKGKPYTLPYEESFAGNVIAHYMSWDTNCVDEESGLYFQKSSADGDEASLGFVCYDDGGKYMAVFTGKIDVAEALKPVLEFDARNLQGQNTLVVQAMLPDGGLVELERFVPSAMFDHKTIDMSDVVAGSRWVRLVFAAEFAAYVDNMNGNELNIDAICVHDAEAAGVASEMSDDSAGAVFDVYSVDGRLLRKNATTTDGLEGIVIAGDRKVYTK